MKKTLTTLVFIAGIATSAVGQPPAPSGYLPPVSFSTGAAVCDDSPWKLVFFDDFNGETIDRTKWATYNVWNGYDGNNWENARIDNGCGKFSCFKDENVVVSNGTVKLLLKNETTTWSCTYDPVYCKTPSARTVPYTSGLLETYYSNHFNSGKFEARIKYPIYNRVHCDFWTWCGTRPINSIDIAESYGDPFWPYLFGGNNRYTDYSLHSMPWTGDPYNLPNVEVMNRYPHQTWWDYVKGTYFNQNDFHTYTCEWDTAVIKFYLDGNLLSTQYKYIQYKEYSKRFLGIEYYHYTVMEGSGCNPKPGTYLVMPGFPYDPNSESNLRLSMGMDDNLTTPGNGVQVLATMEVDYVKVWQRHPELDHHTDLCNTVTPVMTGPSVVCTPTTFNVSPTVTGGYFSSIGANFIQMASTPSSITVKPNNPNGSGFLLYNYTLPGCPEQHVAKYVDAGLPGPQIVNCVRVLNGGNESYNLMALNVPFPVPASNTTYEWTINYGQNYSSTYHVFGQFVSVPPVPHVPPAPFQTNGANWTLKITNSCGSRTITGSQLYTNRTTEDTTEIRDTITYFNAVITDSNAYAQAVTDRVQQTPVEDINDSVAVETMIEKIQAEELMPYLVADSTGSGSPRRTQLAMSVKNNNIEIFPNPTTNSINIVFGKSFDSKNQIQVNIFNSAGRLSKYNIVDNSKGNAMIDVSVLPPGFYTVEMRQGGHFEYGKFAKQ